MPGPFPLASPQNPAQSDGDPRPARRWRSAQAGEVRDVTVSIPLVALLGVVVFVAYRYMGLRVWQAVLCLLFGFLLAATTAAPEIRDTITSVLRWLSGGARP